jgi:hypothetical protein
LAARRKEALIVPDLICHIGFHKTASSTLQHQFFPACANLNLMTTLKPNVREFIQLVTRQDPLYFNPNEARAILGRELSDREVNLLSNESLSGPPYSGVIEWGLDHRSPVLANLHAAYPDADVIVVLRRQDGLARSLYRQYVKRGGTARIQRFFGMDGSGKPPLMSLDRFRYLPLLRYLRAHFKSRILILTFEEFVRDQDGFLDRLCAFLSVARPDIQLKQENVTRLGHFGMEVTRIMNFVFDNMLNRGIIPRIPTVRYGRRAKVSVVEYIHDHWPGRTRRDESSPLAQVSRQIWLDSQEDNRQIDRQFGTELARFGYYSDEE